uniref:C3H1-type domain-containing protein n=1 Tax=Ditylenchus dipsaci TaxID=166011 RepID=A0A915E002_9BILA
MAPEDAGQFDNPGASPAMSSSSSSIITQLPLPLTSLSKLTASLPQSVTDLVANLPFMSKQEVTHGWVECERREISRCPRITDTEDVDIRIIGGTKKEESDSDEDGDTDIRNTLAKSKLDEPTEPKKLTEQPPSVDVLALMNSLKKSGLLNKRIKLRNLNKLNQDVQGACVLPAATCSSMSAAMSAAMAAAITTMPSPTVSSPTSMPMQPSPTSRFDNPPPQSMIHRFGVPPPSMPGFLPPFSAPPPQFSSSPGLLAAAANRQFAGNVAAAALAVAPFSSPPPCLLPPPGLIQPPGLIVPPAPVVISNRLSLDQVDASDGTTPPGLADHSSSSVEHNPVATTAPPASLDSNATTAQMPARTFVKQCTYYASGGCHFGESCRFAHGEEITVGVKQAMVAVRGGGGGAEEVLEEGLEVVVLLEVLLVWKSTMTKGDEVVEVEAASLHPCGEDTMTKEALEVDIAAIGDGGVDQAPTACHQCAVVEHQKATFQTRSRSKSPTSSRRSSDRRETTKSSSQRKRRQSRSPVEQTSRRRRSPAKAPKRRSRERSPDLTYSSSGSGDEDRRKPSTYQRQVHTSSSRRRQQKMEAESPVATTKTLYWVRAAVQEVLCCWRSLTVWQMNH